METKTYKNQKEFDGLALSGGGLKGIAQLGILHYFYETKKFNISNIKCLGGASVGSMISLLLICGYTPMEIFRRVYTLKQIFSPSINFMDILQKYGLMSNESLFVTVKEMIEEKFSGKIPTLWELYKRTKQHFIVVVVNVNKFVKEYISYRTNPHLGVLDAIEMSCNLPLVFHGKKYNEEFYVDGGLADNFPIDIVANDKACTNVLGVVVTGSEKYSKNMTFFNYLYRLVLMPINMMTLLRCKNLHLDEKITLVKMDISGVPVLGALFSSEKKMSLFMSGYQEAKREDTKKLLTVKGWEWNDHAWDDDFHSKDGWDVSDF
jgi:predicted acylesterase/phospholipase RssA